MNTLFWRNCMLHLCTTSQYAALPIPNICSSFIAASQQFFRVKLFMCCDARIWLHDMVLFCVMIWISLMLMILHVSWFRIIYLYANRYLLTHDNSLILFWSMPLTKTSLSGTPNSLASGLSQSLTLTLIWWKLYRDFLHSVLLTYSAYFSGDEGFAVSILFFDISDCVISFTAQLDSL